MAELVARLIRELESNAGGDDITLLCRRLAYVFRDELGCTVVAFHVPAFSSETIRFEFGERPATLPSLPPWQDVLQSHASIRNENILSVPLRRGMESLGALQLVLSERRNADSACSDVDPRLLEHVAVFVGLAIENQLLRARMKELPYLREAVKNPGGMRSLTGSSPAMKAVRLAIQRVATTDSTVLILGETGTGKELVAQAIHQLSGRREHLLVSVNCAALNANIVTSELFGHERGAFTGAAKQRRGRFELAHQGTIFLDEIAELPAETQVLLLRVLQERTIERVGGNEPIPLDVRVIAATHRDLTAAVEQGAFRADLFFRLNIFPIHVPPLRDRKEDIPDLVQHFIHTFNRRMHKQVQGVEPTTRELLMNYTWPGNVRELENLIERMMILATAEALTADPSWFAARPAAHAAGLSTLRDLERVAILSALERSRGKVYGTSGAAAILGLKPTTLYSRMRKHGIRADEK